MLAFTRFTWGIEMTCKRSLSNRSPRRSSNVHFLRRLHPVPPSARFNKVSNVACLDCRSSVGINHATPHWCHCGSIALEMGQTPAIHDRWLVDRHRVFVGTWMDDRNCEHVCERRSRKGNRLYLLGPITPRLIRCCQTRSRTLLSPWQS